MAFSPSFSAVVAVIAQVPFVTTPLPMTVLPSSRVTVEPVSPVPVKLDRATLVMSSLSETPLSLLSTRLPGAAGAAVSRVTFRCARRNRGIAGRIRLGRGDGVQPLGQRRGRGDCPGAVRHHATADDGRAVQQGNSGALLAGAGEA